MHKIINAVFMRFVVPTAYGFPAWNVNLNKTVDLPIKPLCNKTTIEPGIKKCSDVLTGMNNIFTKEKQQNPLMFKSDLFVSLSLPNKNGYNGYSWCGIEK